MIQWFKNLFKSIRPMTELEERDAYYAEAKDLVDLERRMKAWENENLRGWI